MISSRFCIDICFCFLVFLPTSLVYVSIFDTVFYFDLLPYFDLYMTTLALSRNQRLRTVLCFPAF
jgi:hypothetical protein